MGNYAIGQPPEPERHQSSSVEATRGSGEAWTDPQQVPQGTSCQGRCHENKQNLPQLALKLTSTPSENAKKKSTHTNLELWVFI